MAELADALDSKSSDRKIVWVRAPPPADWPDLSLTQELIDFSRVRLRSRCEGKQLWNLYRFMLVWSGENHNVHLVNGKNGHKGRGKPREFVTTRWSLILSAANLGSEEQKARDALAELCRTYWRPIFSFVRARGYSIEDAQDLTQDFFVTILEEQLAAARRS